MATWTTGELVTAEKMNAELDINSATEVTVLQDSDEFGIRRANASYALRKITWTSIKTYLTSAYAALVHSHSGADITSGTVPSARLPHGTSFPASPTLYDRFYRDDLGIDCHWDGTKWLGPSQTNSTSLYTTSWNPNFKYLTNIMKGVYFIEKLEFLSYIPTTNNTSNYWTYQYWFDGSTPDSMNTSLFGSSTWVYTEVSFNIAYTFAKYFTVIASKTGSPGDLTLIGNITYRKVYT